MNKKFVSAAALLMSGAMVFSGCDIKSEAGKSNEYDKKVIGTVGGEEIRLSDYNFAYYSNAAQFEQYYTMYMGIEDWESQTLEEGGQTCGEYVREGALTETKQLIIAEQKAKSYGISADKERKAEVAEQKAQVIEQNFGGEEGYQEYLDSYYTSDAAIERYLLRASIINDLLEKMSEEGGECEVPEDSIEYTDDKYIKVKHVLVQTSDEVTEEQALAKAKEVVDKLNAGEDMGKLVEEYNDDPGMENQEYYVFGEGEMVDEFYEAAKNLEIGTWTTEPVQTSYGYHVIYRYALDKSDDKYTELRTAQAQTKFMEILNNWVEEADSTADDDAIDKAIETQKADRKAKQEAARKEAEQQQAQQSEGEQQSGENEEAQDNATDDEAAASDNDNADGE